MIESYENGLQIAVLLVCLLFSISRAALKKEKAWILLSFFYGSWILGDLYWEIYLIFFQKTPSLFYVADFSWDASYLLLYLLLRQVLPQGAQRVRSVLPWLGAVFAFGMSVFYMQWGEILSNLVCAALMSLLIVTALQGLLFLRETGDRRQKWLCLAVLLFCLLEYSLWTTSCFWKEDNLSNPYYWADILLTLSFPVFLPAVRKAVRT